MTTIPALGPRVFNCGRRPDGNIAFQFGRLDSDQRIFAEPLVTVDIGDDMDLGLLVGNLLGWIRSNVPVDHDVHLYLEGMYGVGPLERPDNDQEDYR